MGACLSCLPHRFFDDDYWRASDGGHGVSRWQRRCRRFLFFPSSCCGMEVAPVTDMDAVWAMHALVNVHGAKEDVVMGIHISLSVAVPRKHYQVYALCMCICLTGKKYDALFQREEEQDGTSGHSGPLLQSTGHSDGTSAYSTVPSVHSAYVNTRNMDMLSNLLRHDKIGSNLLHTQGGETQYRNGSGSGWHREALGIGRPKTNNEYDGDQRLRDKVIKLPPPSKNEKADAVTSLLDDEDICPTCLDGYDKENPKIVTKCGHHFHLACIFEWMERSNRCPLCDKEMVFSESA